MNLPTNQIRPLSLHFSGLLLALLLLSTPPSFSAPTKSSLWNEVIQGFSIKQRKDARLTPHLLWYKKNPDYLNRVLNRARPYLYHIVKRAKKKNLPLELALLPAVESAFRAYAYSPGSAAGLWQFIPATGKIYGLKQNWWIDQRRSLLPSTDAALYFLKDMSREFKGDWLLALAAYNAGAGNVRKAIRHYYEDEKKKLKKKKQKRPIKKPTFWDLNLPRETQGYVPRILALSRFIEQADKYNFQLPNIPNRPLTESVSTGNRQIDLSLAAELAELPLERIYELNAGLNQWATPPDGPHRLLLPISHAERFRNNLELAPAPLIEWRRHKVKSGESMSQIALKYSTTAGMIRKQNRMKNNKLRAGKEITIPIPRQPIGSYTLTASARLDKLQNRKRSGVRHQHTVVKGETLWDIARKYGVSTKQLARWNGMAPGDMLRVGKPLVIWSRERPLPELKRRPAFATKMATQTIYYTVRANDTLSQIAEKFHTTTKALMRQNKLKRGAVIKVGQSLAIRLDATQATQ